MPIVPSRSREIQERVAELASTSPGVRESAIARLTLLGERAVQPLIETLRAGSPVARLGAIKVLEQLNAPRALPALLGQLTAVESEIVAAAAAAIAGLGGAKAVGPLSKALGHEDAQARAAAADALAKLFATGVEEALEPLVGTLLDGKADERLRRIAERALSRLPARELRAIRARINNSPPAPLPPTATITSLHRELQGVSDTAAAIRLHQALAERGSRIALYDLRERLEARPAKSAEALLDIAARIGDASLVASIVSLAADRTALTAACADALAAIVSREKLRRTHRLVKAVRPEHRAILDGLWSRAARKPRP